ncbi:MAG: hypothetical protein WBQ38_01900 [Ignavibacteria bacterium]|nr:hypothetical protein [Ignavibacteria bacterium]MBK7447437.1 hypothetical protein [Ignavibacteria bacterium]MBK8381273.1 hypothetical protein [Ignavibacteria bacterium]MBK9406163.1 hypothetical protein [Ignavibacteria bacterium]MBL0106324.1 hypothetical protein [Ignavibacteria bacterium]
MTDIKIKQNLHTLIDNLQDVRILKLVHEAVCEIIEDKRLKWNSLSENERRSIETGIEQLDKGEKINYEDIKKEFPEWIGK